MRISELVVDVVFTPSGLACGGLTRRVDRPNVLAESADLASARSPHLTSST